jgi:hypothetical protein
VNTLINSCEWSKVMLDIGVARILSGRWLEHSMVKLALSQGKSNLQIENYVETLRVLEDRNFETAKNRTKLFGN